MQLLSVNIVHFLSKKSVFILSPRMTENSSSLPSIIGYSKSSRSYSNMTACRISSADRQDLFCHFNSNVLESQKIDTCCAS